MLSLYLALIGLPAGFALDSLIGRLATAPAEDEDDEPALPQASPPLSAEAGTLRVWAGHGWSRRLAVVAATAGLFAAAGARYDDAAHLALITAYCCALLICAATDLLSYRVPNAITYPAILAALTAGIFMPDADFVEVIAGGLLAGGILLLPALFTGGVGMGMGDVKLAAFVGFAVGFSLVPPALLLMALGGGLVAAFLLLSGLRKRGEPIPYAPFISAGGLVTLLWYGSAFTSLT